MRGRHEFETGAAGQLGGALFVLGVEVGVQEGDGAGREALLEEGREIESLIQWRDYRAIGRKTLDRLQDAGIERLGFDDIQREEVGPGLVADQQAVAEPFRGQEQGLGAFPLQEGVGGDGGAHLDGRDPLGRKGRARRDLQQAAHGLDGGVLIGAGGRKQLGGDHLAIRRAAEHVGEGAAPVDPEFPTVHGLPLAPDRGPR